MTELHRNDKIKIIVVLAIIVGLIFFTFLTIGILVFGGIIFLYLWIFYKGIRQKIENIGVPGAAARNAMAAKKRYMARRKKFPVAYGRHPFTGSRVRGFRCCSAQKFGNLGTCVLSSYFSLYHKFYNCCCKKIHIC